MANKEEMCTYSDIHGFLPGDPWRGHLGSQLDKDVDSKMSGKNKRVQCPVCKRKMWAARRVCHDGCCIYYCVPPHKVKGWWKKPKKQSRDNKMRRRR